MTKMENVPIFIQSSEDVCCLCDFKKKKKITLLSMSKSSLLRSYFDFIFH